MLSAVDIPTVLLSMTSVMEPIDSNPIMGVAKEALHAGIVFECGVHAAICPTFDYNQGTPPSQTGLFEQNVACRSVHARRTESQGQESQTDLPLFTALVGDMS